MKASNQKGFFFLNGKIADGNDEAYVIDLNRGQENRQTN